MAEQMKYLGICVRSDDDGQALKKLIRCLRPSWHPDKIVTKVMAGGYQNHVLHAHHEGDADHEDDVIVRCYGKSQCSGWLSHDQELTAMQVASHAGCFGRIHAAFDNGVVYQFIRGRTLEAHEILDPTIARLVGRQLAQLHAVDVGVLPLVDRYGRSISFPRINLLEALYAQLHNFVNHQGNAAMRDRIQGLLPCIDEWKREMALMVAAFEEVKLTPAFCHYDLHARNIIYDDKNDSVTFLDFEASKFGYAAFDFSYMFNFYLYNELLGVGPVPRETRLIYARSYLERKYELQGRDAGCVKQEEIEAWLIEIQLIDIMMPLMLIVLSTGIVGEDDIFDLSGGWTKVYYERKADLAGLQDELRRLRKKTEDQQ